MQVQIQKVGKSLAVPIPQAFIEAINIKEGGFIDLSFSEGKLIATPMVEHKYSLAELLAGVTPENLHGEVDTGNAVGGSVATATEL
jgi:antitoxin MazE